MKRSTWRLVMEIVGAGLVLAGAICLVIGYWDKLMAGAAAVVNTVTGKGGCKCSEFDDYDDALLYED